MDYIKCVWMFDLEFCTSRYVMARKLTMDKLRVR